MQIIPRLDISFPLKRQWQYWFGKQYISQPNELLLNHARSGIVLALKAALPHGGKVGVVVYNCHTVANAVVSAGCLPVFLDVDDNLKIDRKSLPNTDMNAIIVTNLFGIRNDIAVLRKICPNSVIIVDNAHGYGLPPEGDFAVYSINQGKYPALGPGGILIINNAHYHIAQPDTKIGLVKQLKEFSAMLVKSILYHPWIYGWLTMLLKARRENNADHTPIQIKPMSPGVSRMYNAWLNEHIGKNVAKPFMDIIHTIQPQSVIAQCRANGIEADTHFKNAIRWAKEFGYQEGACPNAERLINELVMVPNYMNK